MKDSASNILLPMKKWDTNWGNGKMWVGGDCLLMSMAMNRQHL